MLAVSTAALPAQGSMLVPGGFVKPVPVTTETGVLLATTTAEPFVTVATSGTGTESVYREADGTLSFDYSISNSAASRDSDRSITMSDFSPGGSSVTTDVYYLADASVIPTDATRGSLSGGHSIGFDFDAAGAQGGSGEIDPGLTSDTLVIRTDATAFTSGTFSVQDGTAASLVGFGPVAVPEPASLGLMLGAVSCALLRRRNGRAARL